MNKKFQFKRILLMITFIVLMSSYSFADDLATDQLKGYLDHVHGYYFDSAGFTIDNTDQAVKTVFANTDTIVDIFYDDFTDTIHNSESYLLYSNKNIKSNAYITVERDKVIDFNGYMTRVVKWYRKPLKHLKDDYSYHAIIDIVKNKYEVYSLQISSKKPIDHRAYLAKFRFIEKQAGITASYKPVIRKENEHWSEETKNFYYDEFEKYDKTQFGIFEPSTPISLGLLKNFENGSQIHFKYLLEYYSLASHFSDAHFKELYDDGRILELTFQTNFGSRFSPDTIYEILDGKYDVKLTELAQTLNNVDGPVLFRFDNEMNGDWCSYNALHFARDTRLFTAMWQYIHQRITADGGAKNVIFVFNPNEQSFPNFSWNHYINYFPGSQYVDVIGVTGYNTGNYYSGETWREFKEIYDGFMPDYKKRFLNYQFYITEFGSSIYGGVRSDWLKNMFQNIEDYGFKVAIYWNGTDWDSNMNPARVYHFFDDIEAVKVFKYYLTQPFGM